MSVHHDLRAELPQDAKRHQLHAECPCKPIIVVEWPDQLVIAHRPFTVRRCIACNRDLDRDPGLCCCCRGAVEGTHP